MIPLSLNLHDDKDCQWFWRAAIRPQRKIVVRAFACLVFSVLMLDFAGSETLAQSPVLLDPMLEAIPTSELLPPNDQLGGHVTTPRSNHPSTQDAITIRATLGNTWFEEDATGQQIQVYLLRGQ